MTYIPGFHNLPILLKEHLSFLRVQRLHLINTLSGPNGKSWWLQKDLVSVLKMTNFVKKIIILVVIRNMFLNDA